MKNQDWQKVFFKTGDFGDGIRAGMRDKPKIGDDEEGSVRQDPEEWIRTLFALRYLILDGCSIDLENYHNNRICLHKI